MSGVGDNAFLPDTTTSRAMFVTMLYRLEGTPSQASNRAFVDVPDGTWYSSAISWASANQVVSGVDSEHFNPDGALTREQLAVILYRYAQIKGYDTSVTADIASFSDAASISTYATQAMRWAVGNQIMNGVGNAELAPQGMATRAQTATMLLRFIEITSNNSTIQPPVAEQPQDSESSIQPEQPSDSNQTEPTAEIRLRITVGDQILTATLEDNATTQALIEKLPLTLPMMDLYGREMCYRFDNALPADDVQTRNFQLGEIIYWPPRHSFVIMYHQDGEQFSMQHIGQIDSGVELFENTGNVTVSFELIN